MPQSIGNMVDRIMEYIHIKMELIKLKIVGQISRLFANVLVLLLTTLVGFFFVFFLSFSLGAYLNTIMESTFLGHLLIAAFYLVLIIVIFLLGKSGTIQGWLENLILKIAEQEDEQED